MKSETRKGVAEERGANMVECFFFRGEGDTDFETGGRKTR